MAELMIFTCNQCGEEFRLYTGPRRTDDQTSWQVQAAERAADFLATMEKHNRKKDCRDAYGHLSFTTSEVATLD